ncbi:MAG: hypothetical protein ABUS54_00920 [Actinomycetota bacterium]
MKAALVSAAVLLVAMLAAGCGGGTTHASPGEDAGVFMTRILREELNGQWAKQWGELHPGHKALITRGEYVACSRSLGTNVGTGGETFKVLRVRDEKIHVPGVPQTTSEVVTITFRSPISKTAPKYDMHAVAVDGRWTWILGGKFIAAIKRGKCLNGSPLQAASVAP